MQGKADIYMYIYGGLGNQLFQAAFAIALRNEINANINLIVSSYRDDDIRSYLLWMFPGLRATIVPIADAIGAAVINEREVRHISPEGLIPQLAGLLEQNGRLFFSGFWQDERYFLKHRQAIRDALSPEVPGTLEEKVRAIRAEEVIGIHVRRHGYGHMGLVKNAYYQRAIEEIRGRRGNIPVMVFTDDQSFCKYMFRNVENVIFQSRHDIDNPIGDFCMLSACRHFVIANSSFSWWAAWLGEGENSIVYAPEPWIVTDRETNPVPGRWTSIADVIQLP